MEFRLGHRRDIGDKSEDEEEQHRSDKGRVDPRNAPGEKTPTVAERSSVMKMQ